MRRDRAVPFQARHVGLLSKYFLVAGTPVRDLSFRAKDLFVAAIDMFGVVQFLEMSG
jgi:hypothetical protein